VRELENTVQRALVTAPGPRLEARDLRFAAFASRGGAIATGASAGRDGTFVPAGTKLEDVEELLIADALRRTRGDKERAARMLGISARTLYRRTSASSGSEGSPSGTPRPAD
jgi:DNA-binding NtrC family response regulator